MLTYCLYTFFLKVGCCKIIEVWMFQNPGRFCQGRGHPIRREAVDFTDVSKWDPRSGEPSSWPSDRPTGWARSRRERRNSAQFQGSKAEGGNRRRLRLINHWTPSICSICFRKGKVCCHPISTETDLMIAYDCYVWIQRSCSQMSFVRSVLRLVKYDICVVIAVIFCHMSKTFGIFWWNKRLFCVFLCTCCASAQVVEHHEKKEFIEKIQKEPVFLQSLHDDTQGHNGSVFHIFWSEFICITRLYKIHTTANGSNRRNQVLEATCISWTYLYVYECVSLCLRILPNSPEFRKSVDLRVLNLGT